MPPRLRLSSAGRISQSFRRQRLLCQYEISVSSRCASTAATATTPAPSVEQMTTSPPPISRHSPTQPPSHRNPEYRRSQLLRQYTSLIRTTPLMVFLQHNNLQSVEWAGIRRELSQAMQKVDEKIASEGRDLPPLAPHIKVQIIQTSIFEVALRIVEYFRPDQGALAAGQPPRAVDPVTQTSAELPPVSGSRDDPTLTHDLSRAAHDAVQHMKGKHELSTLLVGPLAVLSIPQVSPEHMKAALTVLAPKAAGFPQPTRRANPGWHELPVQNGLKKLDLLAARVDGNVFDVDQTKWVGSIEGGMDGLRSQLVTALQSMGSGITSALEGAGKSLYLTLESRRSVLEEEQKGPEEKNES
ncbi:hypothetical protein ASPWEDRAFT_22700 [Aspergillus wentii DTO 134E9]|uniref:Uncharacterized protein n=1 Tax=Aspergillus wentii DTO 134E9 TaxID=1073089 RepID=A0A1L9S034_ASPWE|nr:uncharacterized protein ASPWEDRAFT_22700 [Aspergillus wentii DTO 134E9]KAI9932945.1 hypothetical protein MW887_009197 [Aspergillus wentii]OJJ40532.1 hypothetical protein ASPWEDRAFT_22700 [Aspergillus wentii DTO 134E9]